MNPNRHASPNQAPANGDNDSAAAWERMAQAANPFTREQLAQLHHGAPEQYAYSAAQDRVFQSLAGSRQELRILGYMTQGDDGFNHTDRVHPWHVGEFLDHYPTPAEFEDKSQEFMSRMQRVQSASKYQQYQQSMQSFRQHLYGQQQEYWEQMQAERAKSPSGEQPIVGERLRPTDFGYYAISRAQVKAGERAPLGARLPDQRDSEDSAFGLVNDGFFGVFDGAGGMGGGRAASQAAARSVVDLYQSNPDGVRTPQDLADLLNSADRAVGEDPNAGYTTATIARLQADAEGHKSVMWASVGDSRLYIVQPDGHTRQVTRDEGFENKITNCLGLNDGDPRTKQFGLEPLHDGDRVVLCTDGITGDRGSDLMSEAEVGELTLAGPTDTAAQRLVHGARKTDDRTAIVLEA